MQVFSSIFHNESSFALKKAFFESIFIIGIIKIYREKKMLFAFAVNKEKKLAPTLGQAQFLLFTEETNKEVSLEKLSRQFPVQLKKKGAGLLFCKGIGNCAFQLLESFHIEVICGCTNDTPSVLLAQYLQGEVEREKECFCSFFSRSCGECPGKF